MLIRPRYQRFSLAPGSKVVKKGKLKRQGRVPSCLRFSCITLSQRLRLHSRPLQAAKDRRPEPKSKKVPGSSLV
jgi:hypothetical protein